MEYLILYLIIINSVAIFVTGRDKQAARLHRYRVKESTLLLIAAVGGAPGMYLTMRTINHKTRKKKFMIGIPVIFVAELLIILLILHYGFKII